MRAWRKGVIMSRSAKPAADYVPARTYDEIESEFLGLWLDIARLREKVLALISRAEPPPPLRRIKAPAATSPSSPCSP